MKLDEHIPVGCFFDASDLVANLGKRKGFRKDLGRSYKRDNIYTSMIHSFFKMVIEDVINNAVQFKFSTPVSAKISVAPVIGDDFIVARQNGKFLDVDPEKSGFMGHRLCLDIVRKNGERSRFDILVANRLKDIITKKTNEGFKY